MKRLLMGLILLMLVCVAGSFHRVSAFDPFGFNNGRGTRVCDITNTTTGQTSPVCINNPNKNPLTGPDGVIIKVATVISIIAGAAAVIIIIVGGFQYVMSQGESSKIESAKTMILTAIAGLIVIIAARGIIGFVMNRLIK